MGTAGSSGASPTKADSILKSDRILPPTPRRVLPIVSPAWSDPTVHYPKSSGHGRGTGAMKLGLINSAWAQAGKDTAFGIRMTREIGFDTIDIFADPLDIDVKERRLIKRECERAGLPIVSLACVAVGLIDFNPSVQRFHLQRCRAYLDLAYELEARNVLMVIGEYIWERQVIPPSEQWRTGARNLRELGQHAGDLGLQIALELEPFRLSLVNDVDSMLRFLEEVNHPAV